MNSTRTSVFQFLFYQPVSWGRGHCYQLGITQLDCACALQSRHEVDEGEHFRIEIDHLQTRKDYCQAARRDPIGGGAAQGTTGPAALRKSTAESNSVVTDASG